MNINVFHGLSNSPNEKGALMKSINVTINHGR